MTDGTLTISGGLRNRQSGTAPACLRDDGGTRRSFAILDILLCSRCRRAGRVGIRPHVADNMAEDSVLEIDLGPVRTQPPSVCLVNVADCPDGDHRLCEVAGQ